uniref:Uncharacterized protein n=1 Tax=Rhipicephalus zambeziensis TaxID=60191 RepID=A0A224YCJ1_9ACAR
MCQQSNQHSIFHVQEGTYNVTTGVCTVYTTATSPGRSIAFSHYSTYVKNLAWAHLSCTVHTTAVVCEQSITGMWSHGAKLNGVRRFYFTLSYSSVPSAKHEP